MKKIIKLISAVLLLLVSQTIQGQTVKKSDSVIPDFKWLTQENETNRPKYVWENREDYIYHELSYADSAKTTAPEVFALQRCPWVFNRAMYWLRNTDSTIIAASPYADLNLTGEKQVSAWYSDPANRIKSEGNATTFEKLNTKRYRDCAVLPAFQFHIEQNPILELNVSKCNAPWQLVGSIKGRSGAPFICSGWQSGAKTMQFDIASELKKRGYYLNYAELHFAIGTWNSEKSAKSSITFEAKLLAKPTVIGCLPVIRTIQNANKGVPVSAIVSASSTEDLLVSAKLNGQEYAMEKLNGVYQTKIKNLPVGTYQVEISTNHPEIASTHVFVRVTDGNYWKYQQKENTFSAKIQEQKPLTGSFQGTFFFKDAGLASEKLINSQKDWDDWDRSEAPGEHQHYWESLTVSELQQRFSYLAQNGWDILHLHSHYGIWERFDASGALAPHGIEQLARYVDVASKNNLKVQVTLSSYPYSYNTTAWDAGTTPYKQTLEKGFKNEDWYNPDNQPFADMYHQYIKDFVTIFHHETGIFSFSSSGEGDWKGGYSRFQDTKNVIQSIDKKHVLVSEPIMSFDKIPTKQVEGFTSDVVGYRNYSFGGKIPPDEEMGLYVRLAQILPNSYISEGCYPSSNLYTHMAQEPGSGVDNCWAGMHEYRLNVRDWLYFGLIARMPLMVTWDEVFTEDEHKVISDIRKNINFNQLFEAPNVAILIGDKDVNWEGRARLGKYQKLFTQLAVNYRFIEKKSDALPTDWFIDAAQPFDTIRYSKVVNLPASVQKKIPLSISEAYHVQHCISADRKTMLAYIYNTSNYEKKQFYLSGIWHRKPVEAKLEVKFKNLADGLAYKLYDLDSKTIVKQGISNKKSAIVIDSTKHDYLLVVSGQQ